MKYEADDKKIMYERSRSLGEQVYEKITQDLISSELPPDTHLSIQNLAIRYGVSQTPIRAALMRLETEGLVVSRYNAGFWAAPIPSNKEFAEMYTIRKLLEPETAMSAAINASGKDVHELEAMGDEMKEIIAAGASGNFGRFAMLDQKFHAYIAAIAGNDIISRTLNSLHAHLHLFRLDPTISTTKETVEEHWEIINAINNRNQEAAKIAMIKHIISSRTRVLEIHKDT